MRSLRKSDASRIQTNTKTGFLNQESFQKSPENVPQKLKISQDFESHNKFEFPPSNNFENECCQKLRKSKLTSIVLSKSNGIISSLFNTGNNNELGKCSFKDEFENKESSDIWESSNSTYETDLQFTMKNSKEILTSSSSRTDVETQISILKRNIQMKETQLKCMAAEYQKYEESFTNISNEKINFESVNHLLKDQIQAQNVKLNSFSNTIVKRESEIENLKSENSSLILKLKSNEKTLLKLEKENSDFQLEIHQLKQNFEVLQSESPREKDIKTKEGLEILLKKQKYTNYELSKENSRISALDQEKGLEIIKLRNEIEKITSNNSNEELFILRRNLNYMIEEKKRIKELAKDKETELESQIQDLEEQINNLNSEKMQLKQQFEDLEKTLLEQSAKLQNCNNNPEITYEKNQFDRQLSILKKQLESKEEKLKKLSQDFNLLQQKNQECEQTIKGLSLKLDVRNSIYNLDAIAMAERVEELELYILSSEESYKNTILNLENDLKRYRMLHPKSNTSENSITKLSLENERLRQALQDFKDPELKQTIRRLEKENIAVKGESLKMQMQISNLRNELESKVKYISKINNSYKDIEKLKENLESELLKSKEKLAAIMNFALESFTERHFFEAIAEITKS